MHHKICKILYEWLHEGLQILLQTCVQGYLGEKIIPWKIYPATRSGSQIMRDSNFARIACGFGTRKYKKMDLSREIISHFVLFFKTGAFFIPFQME